jgi:hypothetical protein
MSPKNRAINVSRLVNVIMRAHIYRRFTALAKYSEFNTIVSWAALGIMNSLGSALVDVKEQLFLP